MSRDTRPSIDSTRLFLFQTAVLKRASRRACWSPSFAVPAIVIGPRHAAASAAAVSTMLAWCSPAGMLTVGHVTPVGRPSTEIAIGPVNPLRR